MDFHKALQTSDRNFESILEIMKSRRIPEEVDKVRSILLTINNILDYYIDREESSLKIAVVYFPICDELAQELCEDFVVIKLGFYSSNNWKQAICRSVLPYMYIPNDVRTKNQKQLLRENYKFEKCLQSILSRSIGEGTERGYSLIYSENLSQKYKEYNDANKSYNRKTLNKYWYLSKGITSFSNFFDSSSPLSSCPLSLVPEDCDELYNGIIEKGENKPIENIVIFPTKTADGRYTDYCSDAFQKPYFDDFVNSNSGLRNVFFFCFSKKPYRLRRLFDFKQRMKERIQVTGEDAYDFISFTYEESLILNGKKNGCHVKIELGNNGDDLQTDYEVLFDDITNDLDRHVSRRNEMSICITPHSIKSYSTQLIGETESDENILSEIFRINADLWRKEVEVVLRHFVFAKDIFVIIGNDVSNELKKQFRNYLVNTQSAKSVTLGTFGDLRGYLVDGKYLNEIKQSRILVVSFRNDYTESIFHKYPNSFDPFCINPYQKVLEINNYFYLRQYFYWGRYNYGRAIKKILKSSFRWAQMKPNLKEYNRPTKKLPEDTREEELDRNSSRLAQIEILFANDTTRSCSRSEWMLYKHEKNEGIAPLSDLIDLYDTCTGLYVQPLTPLVKSIYKDFIESEREKDTQSEKMFKQQAVYGLTKQEIESNLQLWKTLLLKKINDSSDRIVYSEIMSHFDERYRISFQSFKRWTEADYGIPRARKMQKFLIEDYLNIRPPYLNLIRRIKERTKNDTETITMNVRHFLNIALLNSPSNAFEGITLENRDLLGINSPDDIRRIINSIKGIINYELVKTIIQ